MDHVDQLLHPPVVGQRYRVRCIERRGRSLPVLGPQHADPEIGPAAARAHWHLDPRFITTLELHGLVSVTLIKKGYLTLAEASRLSEDELLAGVFGIIFDLRGHEQQRDEELLCHRAMPPYNFILAPWAEALSQSLAGQSAGPGWICPHKGTPCGSLPTEADGSRVCRGHGVRLNTQGVVVVGPTRKTRPACGEKREAR